ncbi:MAG: RNA 2',3'-cyclic phosphodiesterase [Epsilonproteobacteria bacterium]|nr:RNA 2',3'-cyclic phosphodiesterase [Campylobacterota bacterium]
MRLFIATPVNLPIYSVIKNDLSKYIDGKWVEGWNLHLTHKFIGEDDPKKYEVNLDIPKEDIKIGKVSLLGERILYLEANSEHIDAINKQINEKFNLKNDKPFKPHITLCRIKKMDKDLKEALKKWENIDIKLPFDVYLYKSTLTKKGPIYEKIYKYGSGA